MLVDTMVAVGGLELIFLALLGFGPSVLIGAFFIFMASSAPAPLAPHAPRIDPPALHAEPPLACAVRAAPTRVSPL
jgi:hypothetical protein